MTGSHRPPIVKHYINYKTGEFVMIPSGKHQALHHRLRKTGKCKTPVSVLRKISKARHFKDDVVRLKFTETVMPHVLLREQIHINKNTGHISYCSFFQASSGKHLLEVTI